MKCVMCNGGVKKGLVDYKEYGVSLGKFTGFICKKCGETFFDSKEIDKIQSKSKQLGLFGLSKKSKVAQVGNSLAIRIPKEIAEFMHLKKEGEVRIAPKSKNEIVIEI